MIAQRGVVEAVAHHVHLAGVRVELGVSVDAGRERAAEVARGDRVQVARQLVGQRPLGHGQDPAGVGEHVGVARAGVPPAVLVGHGGLIEVRAGLGAAHPAVAVPAWPAAVQVDAVHHPVAREPVVRVGLRCERVGPGADVPARQARRHRARDLEIRSGQLSGHRRKVAVEVRRCSHRLLPGIGPPSRPHQ